MNAISLSWATTAPVLEPSRCRFAGDSSRIGEMVRRWLEGSLSLSQVRELEAELPARRALGIVVNNECNQKCSHCFLDAPQLDGERLSALEWREVLHSSVRDIDQLFVVGKEVLLGKTGPEVISVLGELRAAKPEMVAGVITNGTLLHRHGDLLRNSCVNQLAISMEGDERDHDAVRGAGAFAAVRENVEWAAGAFGKRFFIAMTLQQRNFRELGSAIATFSKMGVQNVGLSPYQPLAYTDSSLAMARGDIREFFENLGELRQVPLLGDMCLRIDACWAHPAALEEFLLSEWFNLDQIESDGSGYYYINHTLENGLRLSFRFLPWPLSLRHYLRISAEGHIVAASDSYHVRLYGLNRFGNIRDAGLDFRKAWRAVESHPRAGLIDARFEAGAAPRIRSAYRSGHAPSRP